MNCLNNPWGESITCSGEQCIMPVATPGLGYCDCALGSTHDLAIFRFRSCSVPGNGVVIVALDLVGLIASLLVALAAFYFSLSAVSQARTVLRMATATMTFLATTCAVHAWNGGKSERVHLFFFSLCMAFSKGIIYISTATFIIPLHRTAHRKYGFIINAMKVSYLAFRVGDVVTFCYFQQFTDVTNLENDEKWNEGISIIFIMIWVEILVLTATVVIQATKMLHVIESLPSRNNNSADSAMDAYLGKVRNIRCKMIASFPAKIITPFYGAVLNLATGYAPYSWVVYFAFITSVFYFQSAYVQFARKEAVPAEEHHVSSPQNVATPAQSGSASVRQA